MRTKQIVPGIALPPELAGDWETILHSCQSGVAGVDASCSLAWARSLVATHLQSADVRTLLAMVDGRLAAVVPTYELPRRGLAHLLRERRLLTEAYAGRTGLLVANNDPNLLAFVIDRLTEDLPRWDVFTFGVVEHSSCHTALRKVIHERSLSVRCIKTNESPYIELAATLDEALARLPKKTRWTIRKGEKDLRAIGSLDYEEVTDVPAVPTLLACIYDIERRSWKEGSGTSITAQGRQQSFYETLLPLAAQNGVLSAHVLKLNGTAISYILGVAAGDGVFLDLKESFDASYSEYSPGHVLKRFAIERLIARHVGIYDFMGNCEPYKMRWTDKTYRRLTLALYNRTIRGRLALIRASARGRTSLVN